MEEKRQKISQNKAPFILGVLGGIGLMFVIGFFVLLGVILNSDQKADTANKITNTNVKSGLNNPQADQKIVLEPITKQDWIKGDRKAPISIIEFSDTECPYCKRFHSTMQRVVKEYADQVNWVYRHFPLTSLHSKAVREAEATECAGELGGNEGFWNYVDRLFAITPSNNGLQDDQLYEIADYVGLNQSAFAACLDSGKYTDKVQNQVTQAQRAGGTGTPYSVIVVGDKQIPLSGALPFEQVKTIIDSLLQ